MKIWRKKKAVKILQPKTYAVVPTRVSWSKRCKYVVKSEHPIDTFMLYDEDLAKFGDGKEVELFGGFDDRRIHKAHVKLPCGGKWNLVISNQSRQPTAVYYKIS